MENPKLQEIFEILLLAGYFRVRIPSLSTFDKILGGMTWCITCSNVDLDIDYYDEMAIGQKIKLSEKLIDCLKKMSCPYVISPYQIQGLDFDNLFPIFQWLIKFVLETREYRQDFNKNMSVFLGSKIFSDSNDNIALTYEKNKKIQKNYVPDTRLTKNAKINGLNRRDPLRIYSALIEFDDKNAFRTYNKLCALISGKLSAKPSGGKKQDLQQLKAQDFEKISQNVKQITMTKGVLTEAPSSIPISKVPRKSELARKSTIVQNFERQGYLDLKDLNIFGEEISTMPEASNLNNNNLSNENLNILGEINLDEEERVNFQKLERRQSKVGQQLFEIVSKNREKLIEDMATEEGEKEEELDFASVIRNESERFEKEKGRIRKKLEQGEGVLEEMRGGLKEMDEERREMMIKHEESKKNQEELNSTIAMIESKLSSLRSSLPSSTLSSISALSSQRTELGSHKSSLKKRIKTELMQLESQKSLLLSTPLPFSEAQIAQLTSAVSKKKEKYDSRFAEYANLNQTLAVLQRKIENRASTAEIGQYHLRIVELFERLSEGTEREKQLYIIFNGRQDVKGVVMAGGEVMRVFKENYKEGGKKKGAREEFLKNLQETYGQLTENLRKSVEVLDKVKGGRDKNKEEYTFLLHLEREYFKVLKELQMEYEKNEFLCDQMNEKA